MSVVSPRSGTPGAAISTIRTLSHEAGLTPWEFDAHILPRLDDLVKMKIVTPTQQGNAAGYDVVFEIDKKAFDILVAPWKPLDMGTLLEVERRLKKFRADWAENSPSNNRLIGIDSTLLHVAAMIREEQKQ